MGLKTECCCLLYILFSFFFFVVAKLCCTKPWILLLISCKHPILLGAVCCSNQTAKQYCLIIFNLIYEKLTLRVTAFCSRALSWSTGEAANSHYDQLIVHLRASYIFSFPVTVYVCTYAGIAHVSWNKNVIGWDYVEVVVVVSLLVCSSSSIGTIPFSWSINCYGRFAQQMNSAKCFNWIIGVECMLFFFFFFF